MKQNEEVLEYAHQTIFKEDNIMKQKTDNSIDLLNSKRTTMYNTYAYYLISFYAGVSTITDLAVSYYYKDKLLVNPSGLSQIMSAITLPWSLKPILGLLTDFCPIYGYKRKIYILLCGFISFLCWMSMYYLLPSFSATSGFLFLINICNSFSSVLSEAIVVELARSNTDRDKKLMEESNLETNTKPKDHAKEYVSLFMIFKYCGVLLASFLKGSLVESIGIQNVFFIGGVLPLIVILAGVIMVDRNINKKRENFEYNTNISNNQNNIVISEHNEENNLGNADLNTNAIRNTNTEYNLIQNSNNNNNNNNNQDDISHVPDFSEMVNFIFNKRVLVPIVFIILFMGMPSYSDPFFYFLTNKLHFTAVSLGKIAFCSTLGVLLGIYIYKSFFENSNFKCILIICTLLTFFFTFCANLLVLRINVQLGISDFLIVLFSNSILSMLGEIMLLPLLTLACNICPKNMEGTVFSIFMSALNFGGVLSNISGSFITYYLNITATNYDNLHILLLISNICSLLPLPLLFFINNKYLKGQ